MSRYTVTEHKDMFSLISHYTVDDSKGEFPKQIYTHKEDANELCKHLNNYEKEVQLYKFLYEENRQILAETEADRQVYLTMTVKLAKKLGFKGPGEFHDAIREGYLDD